MVPAYALNIEFLSSWGGIARGRDNASTGDRGIGEDATIAQVGESSRSACPHHERRIMRRALERIPDDSEPGIDWLAFESEHAENALVHLVERLPLHKPLECFDA
jgi:hypothetical protein